MGVGAYFLKVFLGWSSCSFEPVLRSEQVDAFWGEHKLQSLVFATSGGFAQFDKLRENVWMVAHMSLSERCNLSPSSGGWFEERRGGSRVVTNPTVWVRDRRVSIIDYGYRWRVSGIEFLSLTFATNGGFVRFNKLRYELAWANFYRWCAYQNWHERCPIAITWCGLVENQQLAIARDYRERVFIFNLCNNWRICSVCYLCRN